MSDDNSISKRADNVAIPQRSDNGKVVTNVPKKRGKSNKRTVDKGAKRGITHNVKSCNDSQGNERDNESQRDITEENTDQLDLEGQEYKNSPEENIEKSVLVNDLCKIYDVKKKRYDREDIKEKKREELLQLIADEMTEDENILAQQEGEENEDNLFGERMLHKAHKGFVKFLTDVINRIFADYNVNAEFSGVDQIYDSEENKEILFGIYKKILRNYSKEITRYTSPEVELLIFTCMTLSECYRAKNRKDLQLEICSQEIS
jgi:hypothetical protein